MDTSAATAKGLPLLPELGDVVGGRFEVLSVLGEGGMGTVYRALDRERGFEVALKLLIPRYLGRPEREARIFREAELMERVGRHPNLVEMLETGRMGPHGWPYLVMRIVDGESLSMRLTFGGAMAPMTAVKLGRQVAAAVQVLHRAGVVHRDVTPMNVLTQGGQAVLIDLSHAGESGAPQAVAGSVSRLTGPHDVPGTHHYMSREQACADTAHPAMDVYAFGVTLVQMLTGVAPSGIPRDAFIAMQRQGMVEPPTIDVRVHPDVPDELAQLTRDCTRDDAAQRPTMDEIVARMDALLLTLAPARRRKVYPVGGVAAGVVSPVPAAVSPVPEAPPVATAEEPRSRWGLMILSASVVVALVGALWLWLGGPQVEREPGAGAASEHERSSVVEDESPRGSSESELPVAMVEDLGGAARDVDDDEVDEVDEVDDEVPATNVRPGPAPAEAKTTKRRRPAPRPRPAPSAEECTQRREAALTAQRSYDWKAVVDATESRACWPGVERKRLRVLALLELGRFGACVREGSGSADPQIVTLVEKCEEGIR